MNKIRRGDRVAIMVGRDKGGSGVVQKIVAGLDGKPERVVVEGVNMLTSYVRPNPQSNEPGGLIKKEASLHVSNVRVIDPKSELPSRVKITVKETGKERHYHVGEKRRAANERSE